jgi:hypothetical protein
VHPRSRKTGQAGANRTQLGTTATKELSTTITRVQPLYNIGWTKAVRHCAITPTTLLVDKGATTPTSAFVENANSESE